MLASYWDIRLSSEIITAVWLSDENHILKGTPISCCNIISTTISLRMLPFLLNECAFLQKRNRLVYLNYCERHLKPCMSIILLTHVHLTFPFQKIVFTSHETSFKTPTYKCIYSKYILNKFSSLPSAK